MGSAPADDAASAPASGPGRSAIDATAGRAAAALFASLSWLRRGRVFHPDGVAFQAAVAVEPQQPPIGAALLDRPARHAAVLRVSRGVGLPSGWPDVLGVAVRVLDAYGPDEHQDLLMATVGGSSAGLRHVLAPARTYESPRYSTILPYRAGGRLVVIGACATAPPDTELRTFDQVADALVNARVRFRLEVAGLGGPWQPWATVDVGRPLGPAEAESLRFDPFRSGPDLVPAGVLNTVRRRAYRSSQEARPTPLPQDPTAQEPPPR